MGRAILRKRRIVLVIEDHPLVLIEAADIIADAGFEALTAASADEAILILESRDDIWAVFTDVNMPGSLDGLKLAHAVRDRWPPILFLVTSGYTDVTQGDLPFGGRLVRKPYQPSQIALALQGFGSSDMAAAS